MNKKLRILLLTGLAALFCSSCSKMEEILPESYTRNDLPFSVEKVPVEGGTITLQKVVGESIVNIDPTSATQTFSIGDTLILTATAKNGYTFINWKRNGVEKTTNSTYKFCLEGKDIENGRVKYHYEARFGLDYALQVIPPIDKVMPSSLISLMGDSSFLYFGDNPPKIDTCFAIPNIPNLDFIIIDTNIKYSSTTSYYKPPQRIEDQRFTFMFLRQHRGIAEKLIYERCYDSIGNLLDQSITVDSVFIMGEGKTFTVYFKQKVKFKASGPYAIHLGYLEELVRYESVILSGIIDENGPGTGITNFHLGVIVDGYSDPTHMAVGNIVPGIKDILLYSYPGTLKYDATFYQEHLN